MTKVTVSFEIPDEYADDAGTIAAAVEDSLPDDVTNFEWDAE